jgi:hypothetical protein
MTTSKMTKKDYFNAIRAIVIDNQELVDFIDREIELLNRKSSSKRKPTERQIENEGLKNLILETLMKNDTLMSIPELQDSIPELADLKTQRVSALLIALRKEKKVKRTYIKKVAYFSIRAEPDEENGDE